MPHDAFISYSRRDANGAQAVRAAMEAVGVRCWIDTRDVDAGENFLAEIGEAISSAKVLVLILSSHSNVSDYVRREVQFATQQGIRIIPLRVEAVEPAT